MPSALKTCGPKRPEEGLFWVGHSLRWGSEEAVRNEMRNGDRSWDISPKLSFCYCLLWCFFVFLAAKENGRGKKGIA